jgi:hypothetical protein
MSDKEGHMKGVTPELHEYILKRDKCCILYRMDRRHICRDRWNTSHSPYDTSRLTLDHVKDNLMMGLRAPSDPHHLVAMCFSGNVGVPSKEVREAERAYLAQVEP